MDPTIWIAFTLASAALVAIPGPTVMLVLSLSVREGRRGALPLTLGVAAGDLVAMSAVMAGLGALVMASATLFTTLKLIGAAYLVWLGLRMILSRSPAPALPTKAPSAFRDAFWVTALNPKSIAFFLAFTPQFLDPARAYAPQAAILTATFVALGALNAAIYATLAGRLATLLRGGASRWMERAGGAVLIAMGALTALTRRPVH